ncbi:hypothetical protein [Streptomyces carminius]|uniref:hypothetical protein n=1 Tax=Streptomyces carminius TaxID=2665496 RepID=UPI0011B8158E|nr:hypothetical protein [Streptomyces carminius]
MPPRPAAEPRPPRAAGAVPPIPTGPPPAFPGPRAFPDGPPPAHPVVPPPAPPSVPVPERAGRRPVRTAAAALCLVLGFGLLGGAAAGTWLTGDSGGGTAVGYDEARSLWRETPVDTLFPPTLDGSGAGPGQADRRWVRIGVAPDGGCAGAFDPLLARVLSPAGCERLLRATYVDETGSGVTTVGLLFTEADRAETRALRERFDREGLARRGDLMPRPHAVPGTAAAGFGDAQRASWTVRPLADVPVVVYAVSGFADGRAVEDPRPADGTGGADRTSAPAESGLGHDARGIADRIERGVRRAAAPGTTEGAGKDR